MKGKNYSINLNHLTAGERFSYPDSFREYGKTVVSMLSVKDDFLFEDDLIRKYKDDAAAKSNMRDAKLTMDAILLSFPDRFISAGKRPKKKGVREFTQAWFDLWKDCIITPADFLYDLFFIYKLRQTDLLEVDDFLNYFFEKQYDDNRTEFIRFLKLTLRKHSKKLLQPEQIETANEWIAEKEKESSLKGTETKSKGKLRRERDDNVTQLNQEQTALLIYCLRKTKIILKDEYLNNKEAGQAFSVLTGYSADTIRQNLNKSELARMATIKNIDAVVKALNEIQKFVEKEVKPEE